MRRSHEQNGMSAGAYEPTSKALGSPGTKSLRARLAFCGEAHKELPLSHPAPNGPHTRTCTQTLGHLT